MTLPISFVVVHFIADFIAQTDWMALNKSSRWEALALHVSIYTACFVWWVGISNGGDLRLGLKFGAITLVTHFLTDAVTSRATAKLWFIRMIPKTQREREVPVVVDGNPGIRYLDYHYLGYHADLIPGRRHWFFVVIGLDQLIHYVTLALTWQVLA